MKHLKNATWRCNEPYMSKQEPLFVQYTWTFEFSSSLNILLYLLVDYNIYFWECTSSWYCSWVHLKRLYAVVKFQTRTYTYYIIQWLTDRRTDRQTDRQKAMHMNPPCNMHRYVGSKMKHLKNLLRLSNNIQGIPVDKGSLQMKFPYANNYDHNTINIQSYAIED